MGIKRTIFTTNDFISENIETCQIFPWEVSVSVADGKILFCDEQTCELFYLSKENVLKSFVLSDAAIKRMLAYYQNMPHSSGIIRGCSCALPRLEKLSEAVKQVELAGNVTEAEYQIEQIAEKVLKKNKYFPSICNIPGNLRLADIIYRSKQKQENL